MEDPMTNSEHDDKGFYEKYIVLKPGSREDHDGVLHFFEDFDRFVNRKTTPCFVLSPEKRDEYGNASRVALEAYAMVIEKQNPALAKDLRDWIIKILANMVDDNILASHGVEIPEGGTLTTEKVDASDLEKLKLPGEDQQDAEALGETYYPSSGTGTR